MGRYSALLVHNRFGYANDCLVPALYLGQAAADPKRTLWLRLDQEALRVLGMIGELSEDAAVKTAVQKYL
jgi:hypothetical protein